MEQQGLIPCCWHVNDYMHFWKWWWVKRQVVEFHNSIICNSFKWENTITNISRMSKQITVNSYKKGFLGSSAVKICQCKRCGFDPWVQKVPWKRKWQPVPVFLPGKSYGKRGLAGYSPWGHKTVGYNLETKQKQYFYNRILDI